MTQETRFLLTFLVAMSLSYLLTMVIRRLSTKLQLLDFPDERKIHRRAVPYLGGVSVFVGFMMAVGVALHIDRGFRFEFLREFIGLFVATSIIFLLGIFDDLGGSTATIKFAFQAVAATVLWGYGYRIDQVSWLFGGTIHLDPISGWLLTILWFWSVTNAMNLIDGLDGLCSGIGAIAATTLFWAGLLRQEPVLPFLAIALAGALIGFLPHNFHPAKIFLGDTGSLTIGFLIAAMGLVSFSKAATLVSLLVPTAALALPVTDTLLAILRRRHLRTNIFQADRKHIHHRLLRLLPHDRAVVLLLLLTGYSSVLGLVMSVTNKTTSFWILLLLVGSLALVIVVLRLIERASGIDYLDEP
ncbi:MAG: undecaprenyl/decaprenyl-phosphate alpha-N-acetylglucosaminyl 1-phosphate transferase [Candidatus Hydrogenedentota bacterium]|nr:MAG: undecaprenyl/decaprenyl-phosphate alpha-N-acetylglucosaminyl 1-phosphate transferase [Candidatus Hydrogenedentota bacterium]